MYNQRLKSLGLLWYNKPDGDNSGGDNTGGGGGPARKPWNPGTAVQNAIQRYGSAEAALGAVLSENYSYRARHREDQRTIQNLEGSKPSGDSVILNKDEAAEWEAYRKIGKPSELSEKLEQGTQALTKLQQRERADQISSMAQAINWKPSVLQALVDTHGIHLEQREVEIDDGKGNKTRQQVPHARPAADDKAELKPLPDYVESDGVLKEFLPALRISEDAGNGGRKTTGTGGARFPGSQPASQGGGSGAGSGALARVKNQNKARAEAPNPLSPKQPAQGGGQQ